MLSRKFPGLCVALTCMYYQSMAESIIILDQAILNVSSMLYQAMPESIIMLDQAMLENIVKLDQTMSGCKLSVAGLLCSLPTASLQ